MRPSERPVTRKYFQTMQTSALAPRPVVDAIRAMDKDDLAEARNLLGLDTRPALEPDRWLTTREAAEYVGLTVDAFQKHANAREMHFEQNGPGGSATSNAAI